MLGPGLKIAAAHQADKFLWRRIVAIVAALQRHGAADRWPLRPECASLIEPRPTGTISSNGAFDRPRVRFAGGPAVANNEVANCHDCHPLLGWICNTQLLGKVAQCLIEWAALTAWRVSSHPGNLSIRERLRTRRGSHFAPFSPEPGISAEAEIVMIGLNASP
jgi:hypothetical protein